MSIKGKNEDAPERIGFISVGVQQEGYFVTLL